MVVKPHPQKPEDTDGDDGIRSRDLFMERGLAKKLRENVDDLFKIILEGRSVTTEQVKVIMSKYRDLCKLVPNKDEVKQVVDYLRYTINKTSQSLPSTSPAVIDWLTKAPSETRSTTSTSRRKDWLEKNTLLLKATFSLRDTNTELECLASAPPRSCILETLKTGLQRLTRKQMNHYLTILMHVHESLK